jgi:hypothetical protein
VSKFRTDYERTTARPLRSPSASTDRYYASLQIFGSPGIA